MLYRLIDFDENRSKTVDLPYTPDQWQTLYREVKKIVAPDSWWKLETLSGEWLIDSEW